jgi:iron complex transport system substrate-binding protein
MIPVLAFIAAAIAAFAAPAGPAAGGPATSSPEAAWPRTFTDAVGRRVVLTARPARILSLAPSVTENLLALGLAGRLVGVTDFCRIPAEVQATRIGGLVDPDVERIVMLKPDLAVATTSGNYLDDAERISRLGIPVYTTDTPSVDAVIDGIVKLGELTGTEAAAAGVVDDLRERLKTIEKTVAGATRPRVLFVIWGDPILAPGKGTFINDALSRAGVESISRNASSRWVEYDLERILVEKPEAILTVPDNRAVAESIRSRAGWAGVPAVKDGRIHVVSEAIQQPGPRMMDAIEEIARLMHQGQAAR